MNWWIFALIGMNFLFGFLLGSPVGVFLGMSPWLAPSEILLGGLLFQISPLGISMIPCFYFLVCLVGFQLLYYIVNSLNPVWHELLHLWRKFLACWIFWGGGLLFFIFVPLFFWVCITYGICSVTWLVQFTSHILHVLFVMIYCLDCY